MNEICDAFRISPNYNHLNIKKYKCNIKSDDLPKKVSTMAFKLLSEMPRDTEQPRSRINPSLDNTIIDIVIFRSRNNNIFYYEICITKNAMTVGTLYLSVKTTCIHLKEQDIIKMLNITF